jgi:GDP-L-fucose synthase
MAADKIYFAGHLGLVGSDILRSMQQPVQTNFVTRTQAELELTNQDPVRIFFEKEKPTQVCVAAAKLGNSYANNTYPVDFTFQNLIV